MRNPGNRVQYAYAKDEKGEDMVADAMSVEPPVYKTVKNTGKKEEQIHWEKNPIGIRRQLRRLGNKLRDSRYDFICNSGDWRPNINREIEKDLDSLIKEWIGNSKPVTILDLSGIPSKILDDIIGTILIILYDAVFWGRNLPEGARERPLFLILEEAHTYLGDYNSGNAALVVKRIVKEGRKYGVGMMVVSKRPSEINSTILSQCGTTIAMRLSNSSDRGKVIGTASGNLKGIFEKLTILRTGEAIIVGEAVSLPIRTLINPSPVDKKPDSEDPKVASHGSEEDGFESPGGWNQYSEQDDYKPMIHQWRTKSAKYNHEFHRTKKGEKNE